MLRHAARNALLPVVTVIGLQLGLLLSGSGADRDGVQPVRRRAHPVRGDHGPRLRRHPGLYPGDRGDLRVINSSWTSPTGSSTRGSGSGEPTAPTAAAPARRAVDTARPTSLWRDTVGGVLRQRSAVVGLIILGLLVFVAVFAPSSRPTTRTSPPRRRAGRPEARRPCIHLLGCPAEEPQHIFGTEATSATSSAASCTARGRRCSIGLAAVASRSSSAARSAQLPASSAGMDNTMMRLMDVILAFPSLLLAIAIVTSPGTSISTHCSPSRRIDPGLCPRRARVCAGPRRPTMSPRRARSAN